MTSNLKTDENNQVTRGPGRPKGTPNKLGKAAKDAIAEAAASLGGVNRLVEWVQEDPKNEHAFWATIYPKLIPVQLTGADDEDGNPTAIEFHIVRPSR